MKNFVMPPYGREETFDLVKDILLSDEYNNPVVLEIGMTRTPGNWLGDGYSTPFFGYLINVKEGELYSVDIEPSAKSSCEGILKEYGLYTDRVHLCIEDGITFLKRWKKDIGKTVDLLYLDRWDYGTGDAAKISEECHLQAFQAIENDLSDRSLVLIDDIHDIQTFRGKGRLVIPYLMAKGYKTVHLGYQCLFSKNEVNRELLSRTSSSVNPLEAQFETMYIPVLQRIFGISPGQAKKRLADILSTIKAEASKEGTAELPQKLGDVILSKETSDARIRSELSKVREEGARNEDIRWWWNLCDLERRMTMKMHSLVISASFENLQKSMQLSRKEAFGMLRKKHIMFGNPQDSSFSSGKDRPLPYELLNRIGIFLNKVSQPGMEDVQSKINSSSSLNSFIRQEIRKGNI